MLEADAQKEKPLAWRLSEYQRQQILDLIAKGMVTSKEEPQQIVDRPILQNLYTMKYKNDTEKYKNANYDRFYQNVKYEQQKSDPLDIHLDEFSQNIKFIDDPL